MIEPRPVIVVHLDSALVVHDGKAHGITACTGTPFRAARLEEYPDTPRVLCEGCSRAAREARP